MTIYLPTLPCLSTLINTGNQQVCVGLARTIYVYTIHYHICGNLPAQNTESTLYIYGSGHP